MRKFFKGIVFGSILAFSLFFLMKKKRERDERYNINILLQCCENKESLKSMYLAELLELSIDNPINYYKFCIKEAEENLKKSPFIKKVRVKKIKPSTVYVDYQLRKPIFTLLDFPNIAIDKKGYVFPIIPFFSKKNLPEIYLGKENLFEKKDFWQNPIEDKKFFLAMDILKRLKKENFFIKRIDVSDAFSNKREIVLITEHNIDKAVFPFILRINLSNYCKQLGNFLELLKKMLFDYKKQIKGRNIKNIRFEAKCIDMRIKNCAFIEE